MKIRAVVQAEHWLNRAGVRIRYRRIAPYMEALGAGITVDVIDNLGNRWLIEDDVVILSKCTDARALHAAEYLRERGLIVGIDMFDDYFSPAISPCLGQREFLREIAPKADFFLCSTERMREVVGTFAPGTPSHVLNDPFDQLDQQRLARRLAEKARRAQETRRIDVLWFGIGDNPVFPVGIADLAAFAPALQPLIRKGYDVRLKVLTNLRALHSENLARLRRTGLQLDLQEWTEEREQAAMDHALLAFIPVNHQNFSIAKSLNRGISALTGGTQILSAGFDLYGAIGDFRYRDAETFLADLEAGSLKVRAETLAALSARMDDLADPGNEAERLLAFLRQLPRPTRPSGRIMSGGSTVPQAVLHGRRSPFSVVTYSGRHDIMTIGTPYAKRAPRFDVMFEFDKDGAQIEIRIAHSAARAIAPAMQGQLHEVAGRDPIYPFVMNLPDSPPGAFLKSLKPHMIDTRAGQMVHYARTMDAIEAVCAAMLPGTRIYRSELQTPLMAMGALQAAAPRPELR